MRAVIVGRTPSYGSSQVNGKSSSWIAPLALAGLIGFGICPSEAASRSRHLRSAAHTTASQATTLGAGSAPRSQRRLYSPERSLSRKAKLARAHAIATAREMAATALPRYKVDAGGELVPDVRAAAAIIYNPETNEILWEENSQSQRSIASITKVMTATVFLENNPDASRIVVIDRSDVFHASTTHLRANDKVTVDDLLHLLLIASDNAAARALARSSIFGYDAFMQRMNEKAKELGLENTVYADPSGLLAENMSSAYDLARLIAYAAADERIGAIMRKTSFTTQVGKRTITARSTNQIVRSGDIDVVGGKTGFISRSGYCLATLLRLPQSGQQVAFVVLGAKSNASRFWETRHLFNWMTSRTKALLEGDFQHPQQQDQQQN